MAKYADNWGGLSKEDNATYDAMYERYVPAYGKADTLGGEILRAISRIVYRYYNDGDTVARYYGGTRNCSYGAEKFLAEHVPNYEPLRDVSESDFEEKACGDLKIVVDYLRTNPALFETENTEDFLELAPEEEWEDEEDDWDYEDEWGDDEENEEDEEE
jgi:hypothetical protein